jgi:hypothetical protein
MDGAASVDRTGAPWKPESSLELCAEIEVAMKHAAKANNTNERRNLDGTGEGSNLLGVTSKCSRGEPQQNQCVEAKLTQYREAFQLRDAAESRQGICLFAFMGGGSVSG